MNKKLKAAVAGTAAVVAVGLAVAAISLKNENSTVPTVSVIDNTDSNLEKTAAENWSDSYNYVPSPIGITAGQNSYRNLNKDVVGWISINGLILDEPIVRDPGSIPQKENSSVTEPEPDSYYIDKYIYGNDNRAGCIFMDYRDVFGPVESLQSENLVIYGHNMANDSMFGCLSLYRRDLSFYDDSPIIHLSSNYKDYQYIIFGFLITDGSYDGTDFHYWDMEELNSEDEFNYYVNTVKEGSMVDTGVDVKYGDKLLTLQTCYANDDNSRFLVVARRLRANETSIDNIDRTQSYLDKQKEAADSAAQTNVSEPEN